MEAILWVLYYGSFTDAWVHSAKFVTALKDNKIPIDNRLFTCYYLFIGIGHETADADSFPQTGQT